MNYLPDSAAAAWQAYNAMETTKRRHILLLAGLEDRYGSIARAPSDETGMLDRLFHDHDAQVARFRMEMAALKKNDADAHMAVINYMREIDETLARFEGDNGDARRALT